MDFAARGELTTSAALRKKEAAVEVLEPVGEWVSQEIRARFSGYAATLFATLGLRHPLKPKIEWHKHQNPSLWAELLGDVGFRNVTWKWLPPHGLCWLPYNAVTAYVTNSYFTLNARR